MQRQTFMYVFIFKDLDYVRKVREVSDGLLLNYRGFKCTSSFLGHQKEAIPEQRFEPVPMIFRLLL